jgi:hypothetical protein
MSRFSILLLPFLVLLAGCPSESAAPTGGGAESPEAPTVLDEVEVPGLEAAAESAAEEIDEANVLDALDELEGEIGG